MRKQEDGVRWPHETFNAYLNELMLAAGIPLSAQGTPNTVVFEEITDVSPGKVSRWRKGTSQPTSDSLRQVAQGLAPRLGMDPNKLLAILEVKAGRRSEDEVVAAGIDISDEPEELLGYLRRARIMAAHPDLDEERRAEIKAEITLAEISLKAAQGIKQTAEDRLREFLEAPGTPGDK